MDGKIMKLKLLALALFLPLSLFGANTNIMDNLLIKQSLNSTNSTLNGITIVTGSITQNWALAGINTNYLNMIITKTGASGINFRGVDSSNVDSWRLESNGPGFGLKETGPGSGISVSGGVLYLEGYSGAQFLGGNFTFPAGFSTIFNGDILQASGRSAVFNSIVSNNAPVQINSALTVTNGITSRRDSGGSQLRLQFDTSSTNFVDFAVDAFGSINITAGQQNISDMRLRPSGDLILGDILVNAIEIGRTNADIPIVFYNTTESMRITGGMVGIGTNAPATKLHVRGTNTLDAVIRIQKSGVGEAGVSNNMSGLELVSGGMNDTTSKYFPAVKFMSTDAEFTTENPKLLAFITARATEVYAGDTDGGSAIDFATSTNNMGVTSIPITRMTIDQNGTVVASNNIISRSQGVVVSGISATTNSLIQVFSGTYTATPALVTFGTAFAAVPTVVATKTDSGGTAVANDTIFITNITTTTCVVGMRTSAGASSGATITFNGMALGRQ